MDRASLESFIAIAQYRSFSKAAEKMHITQPAISKRIANLESLLNSELLVRSNKEVLLTHTGQIFLKHAEKLIESMNDCITAINNSKQTIAGTLSLGISHHIGLHRLPSFLKSFTDSFPNIHLQIRFITSEEAQLLIQNNELELALITLPSAPPEKMLIETIWNDPLHIVVSGKHPLAKLNHKISLEELCQYPAILPSFHSYTGQLIQMPFQKSGVNISHYIETNNLETIRMMVNIGLGWAALPRIMLNNQLQSLIIKNNIRLPSRSLGLMHHQSRIISAAAAEFIRTLKNNHESSLQLKL